MSPAELAGTVLGVIGVALMVREKLTGLPPPANAKGMVEAWRPFIEEKGAKAFAQLEKAAENQAAFGRALRDMLKALELSEELSDGEKQDGALRELRMGWSDLGVLVGTPT